jgi:predicted DNA-binding protein (MmcQ/YjbR family)
MARVKGSARLRKAAASIRQFVFSLPGAWEDVPWEDDHVAKVGKKVFVFNVPAPETVTDRLRFTVKLPESGEFALTFPYASPTRYGLGRAGWVTVEWPAGAEAAPVEMFMDWVEESYRAVAPKKLVTELDANPPATARG